MFDLWPFTVGAVGDVVRLECGSGDKVPLVAGITKGEVGRRSLCNGLRVRRPSLLCANRVVRAARDCL